MKNEFEELQKIYENFRVVSGMNPPYKVQVKPVLGQGYPDDPEGLSNPYYALRGVKGGAGELYNRGLTSNITASPEQEEREHKIEASEVIEFINKLIEEAQTPQAEQPGFALLQLKSLKNFIKSL
jgi:hypothetical protein|tara:strand:+ start:136 stop:510 length:375 start_codon:yes stop_codon:yes gene_type:complete